MRRKALGKDTEKMTTCDSTAAVEKLNGYCRLATDIVRQEGKRERSNSGDKMGGSFGRCTANSKDIVGKSLTRNGV